MGVRILDYKHIFRMCIRKKQMKRLLQLVLSEELSKNGEMRNVHHLRAKSKTWNGQSKTHTIVKKVLDIASICCVHNCSYSIIKWQFDSSRVTLLFKTSKEWCDHVFPKKILDQTEGSKRNRTDIPNIIERVGYAA